MLDAQIFTTVISSLSSCNAILCLLLQSVLKLVLCGRSIATLAFFPFYLHGITFCNTFTFNLCVCFGLKHFWYAAYRWVIFFYPFSHLSLLIGAFSPFTFKVIFDRYVLTDILLTVFCFCSSPFLSSLLMTLFSVMLGFLCLRFLVCSYNEVYI